MFRVSDRALHVLLGMLEEQGLDPACGLRITPHPTPGEGFRFLFRFAPEPILDDRIVQVGPLSIRLDPGTFTRLEGVELDYVDDLLNRGFRFRGAEDGGCGCSGTRDSALEV